MLAPPAEYGRVSVLVGEEGGAYPYGNSLLVRGSTASPVVDPSLSLLGVAPPADAVLVYRPHVEGPQVRPVERRTAVRHLDRLMSGGRVAEVEEGLFRAS
ncbi:hypothetical protein [Streptomyces litmocidini]|uniref:Uncharacterized protein n=1 Tax=Streptomyces litmocidini TaxID=67318 RepID=A0ABW7U543_9ACTN